MAKKKKKVEKVTEETSEEILDDILDDILDGDNEEPVEEAEGEVATPASEPAVAAPLTLLEGLEIRKEVPPPKGYEKAYALKGVLAFLGGRKHDKADRVVAVVKKADGIWHYVGFGIEGMIDTDETKLWLSKL